MSTCVVKGCTSKSYPRSSLRFYSFPGNPTRRQLWLSKIELKGKLTQGATLCGLHFRPEDYDEKSRLRSDAVPREARSTEIMQCYEATNILDAPDSFMKEPNWNVPDVSKVCRVCLAADRRTLDLRGRTLQQAYSDASGVTVAADDALPRRLCWECAARVLAAARCRARARRAHDVLTRLLCTDGAITMNGVRSINRRRNRLTSQLSHKHISPNDYIYVKEDTDISNIEHNDENELFVYKFPEYVDETHDYDQLDDFETKDKIDPIDEFDKGTQVNDIVNDQGNKDNDEDRKELVVIEISDIFNETRDNNGNDEKDGDLTGVDGKVVEGNDVVKVIEVDDIVKVNEVDDGNDDVKSSIEVKAVGKKKATKQGVKRKRVQKAKERPTVKKDKRKTEVKPARPKYLEEFTISSVNLDEEIAEVQRRKESNAYKSAPYKCDICYRGYIVKEKYNAHILKHTEKYGSFECVICKTRYKTNRILRHHVTELHTEKYSCKKCTFVTRIKTVASNHYKYHNGTKYQCPHCPREFDRTTTYYGHLRVKHACDFVCEYCGHTFLSKRGVMRHKSSIHKFDMDTTLDGPRCEACDVTFASQDAHTRHLSMSSRHNNGSIQNDYRPPPTKEERERRKRGPNRPGEPITCEQCGVTLSDRPAYAVHFRKEHRGLTRTQYPIKNPAIFMCEQCGRKFQSMALLRDHARVHAGVRGLACGACGAAFVTRMTLYAHARTHRAARPAFGCTVCGKQFTTQGNRQRHMFIHTGLKPFECEACGKHFASTVEIRAHIDHVHNKKPWPKRRRRRAPTED